MSAKVNSIEFLQFLMPEAHITTTTPCPCSCPCPSLHRMHRSLPSSLMATPGTSPQSASHFCLPLPQGIVNISQNLEWIREDFKLSLKCDM